jgi:hypothetical protein
MGSISTGYGTRMTPSIVVHIREKRQPWMCEGGTFLVVAQTGGSVRHAGPGRHATASGSRRLPDAASHRGLPRARGERTQSTGDGAANRPRLRDQTDSALSVRPDPVMAAGFPARTDIDQRALGGRAVCFIGSRTSKASSEGSHDDWDNAQPAAIDVRLTRTRRRVVFRTASARAEVHQLRARE